MRIRTQPGDAVAEAGLYDEKTPDTSQPSGISFRYGNAQFTPVDPAMPGAPAGGVIYYPGYRSGLIKVGIACGKAQWREPFIVPIETPLPSD